jgi:VWFA-related protein
MFWPGQSNHSSSKKPHSLAALFLFLGFYGFSLPVASNTPPTSIEGQSKIVATSNLVLLPVKVTDGRGSFVSGLKSQDFQVYEDGKLQALTVFEEGDTPVTVGLVVDHSKSMGFKLRDVADAVSSFAHSSNPQDEMFVVDFNDGVSIELMKGKAFSNDAKELEEALTAVSARGRTALYDAVAEGLNHLQYGTWGRNALILITDGGDNASHIKYSQVLGEAHRSRAVIYAIALVGSDSEENPDLLRRLCKDTGGVAYFPREGESVAKISAEIARDLREQYTLGFVPRDMNGPRSFRRLDVKVAAAGRGKLRVRTRRGYSPAAATPVPESESGRR